MNRVLATVREYHEAIMPSEDILTKAVEAKVQKILSLPQKYGTKSMVGKNLWITGSEAEKLFALFGINAMMWTHEQSKKPPGYVITTPINLLKYK